MRYWFLLGGFLGGLMLAPAGQAAVRVTDVSLGREARGWRVDVKASAKAAYKVHLLPSPDRLIIDVPGATLAVNSQVRPVASAPGGPALRYSQFSRSPESVRIVVDLPAPSGEAKWHEISASPAMSIAVLLPASPARPAPAVARPVATPAVKPIAKTVAKRAGKAVKPAPKAVRATRKKASPPAPERKPGVTVLSARDLEQELLKKGGLPAASKLTGPAQTETAQATSTRKPSSSTQRRRTSRRQTPPEEARSSVTSREGYVDRADLMATMLSLPEGGMALPPVEGPPAAPPVAPAWIPEEAIGLISAGECPEALRRRLVEVLSDPAVQTSQYVWGAETPGQFDCSGLALYIYSGLDVKLPRVSVRQAEAGVPVDRTELRAGDLVFFNTRGKDISHVGIYLGGGRFLHAANPRENLRITDLESPYYAKRFVTARRVYSPAIANSNVIRQGG